MHAAAGAYEVHHHPQKEVWCSVAQCGAVAVCAILHYMQPGVFGCAVCLKMQLCGAERSICADRERGEPASADAT